MLRIVDRYLARELLWSFVAAVLILLLVVTGATVADLLNKIAHGRVAADLLLALIGLRTVSRAVRPTIISFNSTSTVSPL